MFPPVIWFLLPEMLYLSMDQNIEVGIVLKLDILFLD